MLNVREAAVWWKIFIRMLKVKLETKIYFTNKRSNETFELFLAGGLHSEVEFIIRAEHPIFVVKIENYNDNDISSTLTYIFLFSFYFTLKKAFF